MREIKCRRTHEDKRLYAARDIDCEREDKGKKRSLKKRRRRGNLFYVKVVHPFERELLSWEIVTHVIFVTISFVLTCHVVQYTRDVLFLNFSHFSRP